MNKFGKTIGALAVVHAFMIATSASAQSGQITSGSMVVSQAFEGGGGFWTLAAQDLSANGDFLVALQFPDAYLHEGPFQLGAPGIDMSWMSDSQDGWGGQMQISGVSYNLTSNGNGPLSFMFLNANPIVLGQASSYQEPFTFSTNFCGFLPVNTMQLTCDANVGLTGSGTLHLVVSPVPNFPGSVDIQSLSYQFAGVPEPDSLALLLTGVVALGLTWRQTRRYCRARAFA